MARSNPKTPMSAAKAVKSPKPSPASATKKAASKKAAAPLEPSPEPEEVMLSEDDDEGNSDSDDEDEDGISESGLARLVKALGEDGLDDADRAQLQALAGQDSEDEDGDEDVEFDDEDVEFDDEDDDEGDVEDDDEEDEVDEQVKLPPVKPVGPPKSKMGDTLAASLARSGLIPEPETELEEESDDDDAEEDDEKDPEADSGDEEADVGANGKVVGGWKKGPPVREKINNEEAMRRIRDEMSLNGGSLKGKGKAALPWIEHMMVTYDKSIQEEMGDEEGAADDDLKRELAFYKQALHTAVAGRSLVESAGVAFNRPSDFYAEQVKSDEHMERVRQRLLDESAGIKASEEAKRQRELKKFGKKVQVEKQLERQKSKKDLQERVKGLKRKRGDLDTAGDDDFDVRLDAAISGEAERPSRGSARGRGRGRGVDGRSKMPRSARDEKFGYGGKVGRRAKQNTRESTNDFGPGSSRGGGGRGGRGRGGARGARGGGGGRGRGSSRPGKDRRSSGRA